jgi:hypothetical protein
MYAGDVFSVCDLRRVRACLRHQNDTATTDTKIRWDKLDD